MLNEFRKKLTIAVIIIILLFLSGVAGYVLIEHWSVFDAVYMTVITLATVGYGETHPLSNAGRLFTMILIMVGLSTFIYGVSTITAFFIEGELGGYLRRKKMANKIEKLEGHYIICGSGEVGRYIIEELYKTKREFVVIEDNPENLAKLKENDEILCLAGDPAEDEILLSAGIQRAKGLVTALAEDPDNLFVVISAKSLNPGLRVVSRAVDEASAKKLTKAGADAVVSTEYIGGLRMASELLRPAVVTFLDKMLRGTDSALRVEEIEISANSSLLGQSLKDANITDRTGLAVIAIKNKETGGYEHVPKSSYKISPQDILIVIGTPEQIGSFKNI
jgi:voltage-gated potassium channel